MSDTQDVARIRARIADEYWQATDGAHHDLGTLWHVVAADLRTLLRILDRQQAVIQAAGEVVADVTEANWYEDANTYLVGAEKLDALHDALAALEGADDGE